MSDARSWLDAALAVAARQRAALLAGNREALERENAALADLLVACPHPPHPGDAGAARLARDLRDALDVNAVLARNGAVITGHLAERLNGVAGCRLSVVG